MSVINIWYKCPKCGQSLEIRVDTYYLSDDPICPYCQSGMIETEREQERFQEEDG